MDRLSTLLPKVLRKRGIKDEADASLIVHHAEQILRTAEGVTVQKFQRGTLYLETETSVAAQEAQALTPELLETLQKKFPDQAINGVRILRGQKALVS